MSRTCWLRGIDVSYETVRRWSVKFGLAYARKLRRSHPPADTRWHLDEVFVSINGRSMYLWRAVDCEGEVLDVLVQSRRNKRAALKLMRKLLKTQGFVPAAIVTDKLSSYGAALSDLGMKGKHLTGGQPGRELSPADPAERTTNAEVQVSRFSPEIFFNAKGDRRGVTPQSTSLRDSSINNINPSRANAATPWSTGDQVAQETFDLAQGVTVVSDPRYMRCF